MAELVPANLTLLTERKSWMAGTRLHKAGHDGGEIGATLSEMF